MKSSTCMMLAGVLAVQPVAVGQPLQLDDAEQMAIAADPEIAALESRSRALDERAVAAGQLPDPKLKLAALALPVDTFDLDQEPMTQLQVGVVQQIPPGRTLDLQGQRLASDAQALAAQADLRRRERTKQVRVTWLDVLVQREIQAVLERSEALLDDLRELVEDYYGTGRANQQAVYRSALEASRLSERRVQAVQAEAEARARLAAWIGEAAYGQLAPDWPELDLPAPAQDIIAGLTAHPAVQAVGRQVDAAELAVAIADEQYKPGFSLELSYGDRQGADLTGRELPDFLSAMVMVDLPIFRDKRQDRSRAASRHQLDAALADRSDVLRRLRSATLEAWARLDRIRERMRIFDEYLLPQAENNAGAALDAYEAALVELTELMRARITEYELKVDRLRLQRDELAARAELLFLEGTP